MSNRSAQAQLQLPRCVHVSTSARRAVCMATNIESSRPFYWNGHLCEETILDPSVLKTLCSKDVSDTDTRLVEPNDLISCEVCVRQLLSPRKSSKPVGSG